MYLILAAFIITVVVLDIVIGAASRKPARCIYDLPSASMDD